MAGYGIDPSILLQAKGIQTPNPVDLAHAGLSLADLSSQNQIRQYALKKQQRDDLAQQALGQILPQLQQAGWSDEAVSQALQHPLVQQNPEVANALLTSVDARRKSDVELQQKRASAFKDTTEAKTKLLAPLTNQAYALANKPDLSPEDIRAFSANIARNDLQGLVQNIPFQDWNNPEAARKNLKTIGSAFFEAEKQVSTAETGRHNVVEEKRHAEDTASQIARRIDETNLGFGNLEVSQRRLALERENAGRPTIQTDAEGNMYAVNPRTATGEPIKGPTGAPLKGSTKAAPEAYSKPVAGIQNLSSAIDNYTEKIDKWSNADLANPSSRAEMGTAYTNMLMQAKEAFNLGVLNGPDYMLMQQVVFDPVSIVGAVTPNKALKKQAEQLREIMERNKQNFAEVYKQPAPKSAPKGGKGTLTPLGNGEFKYGY